MSKKLGKTRVDATKDKLALLQEMQGMIDTLKKFSARIQDHIEVMLEADLQSMKAEMDAIDEMTNLIKKKDE